MSTPRRPRAEVGLRTLRHPLLIPSSTVDNHHLRHRQLPSSPPYTDISQTSISAQCLQKLPATNKFTYNCDGHTFNYLVEGGFSKSDLI
ncbi:hypothetical protein R6Q57_003455 [Mikania cordata]